MRKRINNLFFIAGMTAVVMMFYTFSVVLFVMMQVLSHYNMDCRTEQQK